MSKLCSNYAECLSSASDGSSLCLDCKRDCQTLLSEWAIDPNSISEEDKSFLFIKRRGCTFFDLASYLGLPGLKLYLTRIPDSPNKAKGYLRPSEINQIICWVRNGTPEIKDLLSEILQWRSLPPEIIAFLSDRMGGCQLSDLEKLLGKELHHLADAGKIIAYKAKSDNFPIKGKEIWFVAIEEAIRICDKVLNWISVSKASKLAQKNDKVYPIDRNTLREYVLLDKIGPSGTDLYGNLAITVDHLSTLGADYDAVKKERHVEAGKRTSQYEEGELTPESIRGRLKTIPYKRILRYFEKKFIPGEKRSGRWTTTEKNFEQFINDAVSGRLSGRGKMIARNIAACSRYAASVPN